MNEAEKVIIVEGNSDKKKIKKIITEQVEIICTNGTIGVEQLENIIEDHQLDYRDVYLLLDEDDSGHKLRKQLTRELPHAQQLYVDRSFREVETTPDYELASILVRADIAIDTNYLKG
ncbi:toprim domain-containing protein [Salirhabdus salicampi]|uniref:toprim domain-containing protein n=1 Tax=Salirhabdus salicampi TaxID=476102 RepID=UPI0020C50215|nr:toprim domain-containing protein [Salirhabdus salicampi]MCP8617728.1 toprim domain-containing protein [Salirhabdus salicampi]